MRSIWFILALFAFSSANSMSSEVDLEKYNTTHICVKCDLSRFTIIGYENAILDESKLTYSYLAGKFVSSRFVNAILSEAKTDSMVAMESNFNGANLNYAKFKFAQLSGSKFINANLKNANFALANLSSADFTNADVKGVDFSKAILIGSNLTQKQLASAKSLTCAILPDGKVAPPVYSYLRCRDRW